MPDSIDRRKFISAATALAMLGGAGITIGCGSSAPGTGATLPPPPPPSARSGSVSSNHGHSAIIQSAALEAGGGLSLNIQGTATHAHTVVLSATQVQNIRDGARVEVESTSAEGLSGVHSHSVVFA